MSSLPSLPNPTSEDWLSLHEASAILGISLSTLRRWADAGKVPVHRTLGGHRRFFRQELDAVMPRTSSAAIVPVPRELSWNADGQEMVQQEWHRNMSMRPAAERMRGLGQRLLGLLIQHVHSRSHESRFLNEARAVGTSYGKEAFDASISLYDTVNAFLFFRRTFSQLTAPAAGIAHPVDLAEAATLQEQIDAFMDAVLLGALAGYENQRSARTGNGAPSSTENDHVSDKEGRP
jgi:excisionase family DNA binding protein